MVYHVLRDGTTTTDITGHVVKMEDAEPVYELMSKISPKRKEKEAKREG